MIMIENIKADHLQTIVEGIIEPNVKNGLT